MDKQDYVVLIVILLISLIAAFKFESSAIIIGLQLLTAGFFVYKFKTKPEPKKEVKY